MPSVTSRSNRSPQQSWVRWYDSTFSSQRTAKHRIMDRVAQLADQEKENVSLAERNGVLADRLADDLKKSSNRSSSSLSSLQLTTNLLILEMIQAVLKNLPLFQLRI
jgi:hypothetical protein